MVNRVDGRPGVGSRAAAGGRSDEVRPEDRAWFESLRNREFSRLDREGDAYLDWTGAALYPESLPKLHLDRMLGSVLGNPHSENPSSRISTEAIEDARRRILGLVGGDPELYDVCFTANATAALRLVAEAFPFQDGSRFVLSADNHNSVNGIREFAVRAGADVQVLPLDDELRLHLEPDVVEDDAPPAPSLFAYPAQSNFSGVKHPLGLAKRVRGLGYRVLLDAAAFVPTTRLDLREVPADFVALSFYKIAGFPTGVGALVARRDALALLRRPWFAGGTVAFASGRSRIHRLLDGPAAFEDGTPDFQALAAVPAGVDYVESVGYERIGRWVRHLTRIALSGLTSARRGDGGPAVRLYGPTTMRDRGGGIAFNVVDADGRVIAYDNVVAEAAKRRIHLRGGCFCNPGASEFAFGISPRDGRSCLRRFATGPFSPALFSNCLGGRTVGAVRASFGPANSEADVERLVELVRDLANGSRPG